MSRVFRILGLLLLLPYGYVGYYWLSYYLADCASCQIDAHMLFYSFVLLVASPFLLAGWGLTSAISAGRAMRSDLQERQPVQAAANGGMMWLAMLVAVPAFYASWQMYDLLFPEVEEGRDRLGRICEKEGSRTVCRPDPDSGDEMTETLNAMNRKQRGF